MNPAPYNASTSHSDLLVRVGGAGARYNGVTNVAGRTGANVAREKADFARIHARNQPFDVTASLGDHVVYTPMMRAFFSSENMRIILNGICAAVYYASGDKQYIIPYQNPRIVSERMRAEFEATMPYEPQNARADIAKLNDRVISGEVRSILRNIEFMHFFKERVSTLPVDTLTPQCTTHTRHTHEVSDQVLFGRTTAAGIAAEEEETRTSLRADVRALALYNS